jgi:CubicO group peptidase (beta-lactamase class C family)
MSRRIPHQVRVLVLALTLAAACDVSTDPRDSYVAPVQTNDGWRTAAVEAVGMSREPLDNMLSTIAATEDHMIHSILIVRDGRLVFEVYWDGMDMSYDGSLTLEEREFDRETLHYLASVSKSVTSALVGIAMDRGLIDGVEEPVFSFYPEYGDVKNGDNEGITLANLLAMCSGYDWNEFEYGFDDPRDSHFQLFSTSDPLRYLLGRDLVSTPGSEFLYNSGDTNLLGEVVRRVSESDYLTQFADRYLFAPLGINAFHWTRLALADEITFASGGLFLRPRDMAKFGQLYLNGGSWDGQQVISSSWVDASTEMSIPLIGNYRTLYGYGYQWWLGSSPYGERGVNYYRALGWGGQYIFVVPEFEIVIVFTAGGYWDDRPINFYTVIEDYIFDAIVE